MVCACARAQTCTHRHRHRHGHRHRHLPHFLLLAVLMNRDSYLVVPHQMHPMGKLDTGTPNICKIEVGDGAKQEHDYTNAPLNLEPGSIREDACALTL